VNTTTPAPTLSAARAALYPVRRPGEAWTPLGFVETTEVVRVCAAEVADAWDLDSMAASDRDACIAELATRGEAVDAEGEIVDVRPECADCGGLGRREGLSIGGEDFDRHVDSERCEACEGDGRVAA
jgi:hypothetical protein